MPGEKQTGEQAHKQQANPGTQPAAAQHKPSEQYAPGPTASTQRKGTTAQRNEHPLTGRSAAPEANAPSGNPTEKGPNASAGKEQQTPGNAPMQRGRAAGQNAGQTPGKTVTLNSRQETEVRSALFNEPAENIGRVDFTVAAGTIVPKHVAIRPLPERIAEIVPEYRGYDFAVVRQEIVIIEPRTRRIVTVLHREGRSAVNAPRGRLHLTSEQRQLVRRDLGSEGSPVNTEVRLGERVPENVSLLDMPPSIVSEVPALQSYGYFVTDEDVVLVAPDTREIVEIIR
jgi:hypothetical protein